jgi:hypothetical protein
VKRCKKDMREKDKYKDQNKGKMSSKTPSTIIRINLVNDLEVLDLTLIPTSTPR